MKGANKKTSASRMDRVKGHEEEPEHHSVNPVGFDQNITKFLEDRNFQKVLKAVCQSVFKKFGPSPRFMEWQDLLQDTAIKFLRWRSEYRHEATYKTTLNEIATNLGIPHDARAQTMYFKKIFYRIATDLCIDEVRRQKALPLVHEEIDLDTINIESFRDRSTQDTELRILLSECRDQLSDKERMVFDEHYIEGRSLTDVAKRHGFSSTAAVNLTKRILKKLKPLVADELKSDKSFGEAQQLLLGKLEQLRDASNALSSSRTKRPEEKLEQMLLKEGLLSEIPTPITDFTIYRNRKPVKVRGKPISETIIEERR